MNIDKLITSSLKKSFFLLFIGNLVFFIITAYFLPIRFEMNDDIAMLLLASGEYTGKPEPNLVFINYIYGCFLTFLYNMNRDIEWYTVVFSVIHIISLSIISWNIIGEKIYPVFKIIFLLIFYALEARLILLFQFTTTAALCSLAGIVLLCYKKNYQKIAGIALFIVSSLIRFEASLLILAIASPILIKDIYSNSRHTLLNSTSYLLIALTVSFIFKYYNNHIYQKDEALSYYLEYNKFRGLINDNPNAGSIVKNLPEGVSQVDYYLLLSFFPDGTNIDLDKIKSISMQLNLVNYKTKIKNVYPSFRRYTVLLSLILIAWCLMVIYSKRNQNRFALLVGLSIFILSLSYLSLERTLKYRVFLSALLPLLFVMYSNLNGLKNIWFRYIFTFTLSCFIIVFSYRTYNIRKSDSGWRINQFNQQISQVNQYLTEPSNSIIPFGGSFTIEYFPPFRVSKLFYGNRVFISGWMTNNPSNRGKYDSYLDIINRHSIFVNKDSYNVNKSLSMIKESIYTNYGINVYSKIESSSDDNVIVKLFTNNENTSVVPGSK